MDHVYQSIWDADQSGNGVPAVRPGENYDSAVGYVIVDEQSATVERNHRVLKEVKIPPSKIGTYLLCQALFDNYALLRSAVETVRPEETQEELNFIDAILPTPPIQRAREILQDRLDLTISNDMLGGMIKETWFKMGSSGSQDAASGFEHVFVGEQSSSPTKIGGYHYWHKYFLDDGGNQSRDRVHYNGTQYQHSQQPSKGILVPEVVTLSLVWTAPLGDRNPDGTSGGSHGGTKTLTKPIGGFFVGCSPECLIALGLVRCRTPSGKITKINGAEYQLDLHRLDGLPNSIRTFFPRFRRADVTDIAVGDDDHAHDSSGGSGLRDEATFKIVAAMVNAINPEGGREFVQIINLSDQRESLAGYRLVTPNGTSFTFSDVFVSPGDLFKFVFPTSEGALRNKAGVIRLFDSDRELVQSASYTTEQAAREGAPIVFG